MDEWSVLTAKVKQLPIANQDSALLRRALFSAAEDLEPDRQGRILISQRLREFAQINGEVQIVGMDSYLELWDPSLWNERVLSRLDNGELSAELFATLNI